MKLVFFVVVINNMDCHRNANSKEPQFRVDDLNCLGDVLCLYSLQARAKKKKKIERKENKSLTRLRAHESTKNSQKLSENFFSFFSSIGKKSSTKKAHAPSTTWRNRAKEKMLQEKIRMKKNFHSQNSITSNGMV
jgi:biopolymer transport protein ExbB/TolQ